MRRVVRILIALALFATITAAMSHTVFAGGTFTDDDTSIFEADIEWLASEDITRGCNPPVNDHFCPDDNVTRGQMAAFLVRAFGYVDDGGGDLFVDDNTSIFEADIDRLGTAGVTRGCNPPVNDRFCPDDNVTRGQMAAFLVRAFGYTDDGGGDLFTDDDTSIFEADIDRLGAADVTRGCNPPTNDRFCPTSYVTRGQMAAFLHRAFTAPPVPDPLVITTMSLPDGAVGVAYNAALTATGGVTPYTWIVTTGTLPEGLTLDPGGTITGTPTTHESVSFTVQATDSVTVAATKALSIDVSVLYPMCDQPYIPHIECVALGDIHNWTNGMLWTTDTGWFVDDNPCGWYGVECLAGHVSSVNLGSNNLDGTILPSLGHLTELQHLDLGDNELTGSIPPELGNLSALDYLSLHHNGFTGPIPPELGDLSALDYLEFESNGFTGPIPPELGNLGALTYLDLYDNELTGSIPPELGNLALLEYLHLANNELSEPIPAQLGNLASLKYLFLFDNGLTGPIPPQLGNLAALKQMDFYHNELTGSIPPELGDLHALEYLYLDSNQLSGLVPDALRTGTAITSLMLRGQTGCLTAETWALFLWLEGFDPEWNDGCF
ncbi:MAG: putative Ig domain-containing protein [Actinomycetota bacterium]|nr:putative Ig domain-containing protein [Actinomycetota bacterium]